MLRLVRVVEKYGHNNPPEESSMAIAERISKSEEIKSLQEFVAGLPRFSYLRDVLQPFVVEFESGVYSDFVPSVRDSWDNRIEADKEAKVVRQQVAELERQRDALRRELAVEVSRYREGLKKLRDASNTVAAAVRLAGDALDSANERTDT